MKRFIPLLLLCALSFGVVSCSDSYDDAALKEQLADLERRMEAAETVLRAYNNNLFISSVTETAEGYEILFSDGSKATIRHGKDGEDGKNGEDGKDGTNGTNGTDGTNGADGKCLIKSIVVGKTEVTFTLTDGQSFSIPIVTPVSKIHQVNFVPRYDDGRATVTYSSVADSHLAIDFQISPREAAVALKECWADYCSIEAIETESRAEATKLPIESCTIDEEKGILTIEAAAANLGASFFTGKTSAAVALVISDGATTHSSDYVRLAKKEVAAEPDPTPDPTPDPVADGRSYVFDLSALPEIHIEVSLSEWNRLLSAYDADQNTDEYIHCDARFIKDGTTHAISDAGLRLRGNTSRRRPEGNSGEMHKSSGTKWRHVHFMLNLRKYVKDDAHTIGGVRKIHLKWCKDDPTYVREMYCYNLFRRYGIETGILTSYGRLWIKIEGDAKETYFGVYEMLEAIDEEYLKARKELFGDAKQNLWKCGYGADLSSTGDNLFVNDDDAGTANWPYVLKTNTENFAAAKTQLVDFIQKLKGKSDESLKAWIPTVCNVELLLKTYAVNVAVGMWDDYWVNKNNYYIYFNTSDQYAYQFFFIPYDYDNTLGTSSIIDAGRQDPLNWGNSNHPLISRLLKFPEYRKIYVDALNELCNSDELFKMEGSVARIKLWQQFISPYVSNDTGEDMSISDRPASWGNHSEYRLMDTGSNNFFKVKKSSIPAN